MKRLLTQLRDAHYAVTDIRPVDSVDGPCRYCDQTARLGFYYRPQGAEGYLQTCADDALAAADHAANDSTDGTFHIEAA